MFTGRYPHSNGLIGLAQHGIEYHERVRTLPQIDLYLTSREALANIFGVLDGLILPVLPVVSKSALPGLFEAGLSCFANGFSSSFVFVVVGGDVSDAGVQADGIPVRPYDGEFGAQNSRVGDRVQVRVLGLEVAIEALDPRLIRRTGAAKVLRDRAQRHELSGRPGCHLRPVVRDGE